MKLALTLILSLFLANVASAATYYIRPGGGDATECTGLANVDYDGSGTGEACAWAHPMQALRPNTGARIAGGDTLIIGSGSYDMGYDYTLADDDRNWGNCHSSWPYDCWMRPIPDGTSGAPTKIYGEGYDTGCKNPPELWGTQRAYGIINLTDSDWVEIKCLELTDHLGCTSGHCTGTCPNGATVLNCPTGSGATVLWAARGVFAYNATNILIEDVNIHGLSHSGIMAGKVTNFETNRVRIVANGTAGWHGDTSNADDSNSGDIIMRNGEIAWNGCVETYPEGQITGCWGQQSGGYGDGIGTGPTAGDWLLEDMFVHHNTSDGIDLLYNSDAATTIIRRTRAWSNSGNQMKVAGAATIENNYIYGTCSYWWGGGTGGSGVGRFAMEYPGDICRALGAALVVGAPEITGTQVTVVNNTITGAGDCLFQFGGGLDTSVTLFANNFLHGQDDWYVHTYDELTDQTCGIYDDGDNDGTTGTITYSNNHIYDVKNGTCPGDSVCTDPQIITSTLHGFNGRPSSSASPLVDAGDATYAPADDVNGTARPIGSADDVGAFESY